MAGLVDREPSAADQVGAVEALAVIVREAARRKLWPVSWRVGDLGSSLVVRADRNVSRGAGHDHAPDYAATREQRRAVFEQYVDLLRWLAGRSVDRFGPGRPDFATELKVWPERTDAVGVVHLVAGLDHVTVPLGGKRQKWLLRIAVLADLDPDPERLDSDAQRAGADAQSRDEIADDADSA